MMHKRKLASVQTMADLSLMMSRLLSNTHVPQTVAPKMDERAKKSALQSQRRRHLRKFRERVSQALTAYGVLSR